MLLTTGFFVCGFHVAFITVHFPAYVTDIGLSPHTGAYALAIVGLLNIVGSFASGALGQRFSKKVTLSFIYFGARRGDCGARRGAGERADHLPVRGGHGIAVAVDRPL